MNSIEYPALECDQDELGDVCLDINLGWGVAKLFSLFLLQGDRTLLIILCCYTCPRVKILL